jgi:hypothetical protein
MSSSASALPTAYDPDVEEVFGPDAHPWPSKDAPPPVMTWGKYKGSTADVVFQDQKYCYWLINKQSYWPKGFKHALWMKYRDTGMKIPVLSKRAQRDVRHPPQANDSQPRPLPQANDSQPRPHHPTNPWMREFAPALEPYNPTPATYST